MNEKEAVSLIDKMILIKESKVESKRDRYEQETSYLKQAILSAEITELKEDIRRYKKLKDLIQVVERGE